MAAAAQKMLRDVMEAFVRSDPVRAEAVIAADPAIDTWMARIFEEIQVVMTRDPSSVARGLATVIFAKHIERMGDHVTNIAEMIIYLALGQDVRHAKLR
jgi:phosphate transport system protein